MNKEEIEELAFKDRKELANLNELDLLEIIEFLQLDRKQWINQYSTAHNDYVDLQQENKKQKEIIDKATNELFILKDMIYKPETREENFEIQRKISSIIKRLNGKEVSE